MDDNIVVFTACGLLKLNILLSSQPAIYHTYDILLLLYILLNADVNVCETKHSLCYDI